MYCLSATAPRSAAPEVSYDGGCQLGAIIDRGRPVFYGVAGYSV